MLFLPFDHYYYTGVQQVNDLSLSNRHYGMTVPLSEEMDIMKYRQAGETYDDKVCRIAGALRDSDSHFHSFLDILREMRFVPAGRVQNAMGSARETTAYNCFVSPIIQDSMDSIMSIAGKAAEVMRRGGGIGYDFSRIRPKGDLIKSLDSKASGPVSYMGIFDAVCQTIASSGHRRGAQMGVLRIDHPDNEIFLNAKHNNDKLTGFNVSFGVTDKFFDHVDNGEPFPLIFEERVYKEINAANFWDAVMRSTWDYAEPGVLYLDTINAMNNLHYCETIEATNPCAAQCLPPNGACLLGSFNLTKYVHNNQFDFGQFTFDIPHVVRAMDNVVDRTIYPLPEQEVEGKNKRRMGLGVMGLANAAEMIGYPYASADFMEFTSNVLSVLRDETYSASADLAEEKGAFPLYDKEKYLDGNYTATLPDWVRDKIGEKGIRNSHLTSIAPTGTISLISDNISSGIEPPFLHYYDRTIQTFDGPRVERVMDYAYSQGVEGRTANEISAVEHVDVLNLCSQYIDSAVSKTCNVGDEVTYDQFKSLYRRAWEGGSKGCTTFRASGKRYGILNEVKEEEGGAEACFIDLATGAKTCD